MTRACLLVHGCRVRAAGDAAAVAGLAADLAAFAAPGSDPPDVDVLAELAPVPRPPGRALFARAKWTVLASPPGTRKVWYPEGALCELDYVSGKCRVSAGEPHLLRELLYLLVLSRAGEWLDRRGLHRLHAGALASAAGGLVFCGSQGTGKTTLLLELLRDPAFALISDDTPLLSPAGLLPFPLRVGLDGGSPHLARFPGAELLRRRHYPPKRLVPAGAAGRLASGPVRPAHVFLLRRGPAPRIERCGSAPAAAALAAALVAGHGVPQMAEYFLRPSPADAAAKAGILLSRLRAAAGLIRDASFWTFVTGPGPERSADALRDFLRSCSGPGGPR